MDFADQNNVERISTLFDSCFFSGGAIPEGSFLCLAPTTEAESAKVCLWNQLAKLCEIHAACFLFPVAKSDPLTEDVDLFLAD